MLLERSRQKVVEISMLLEEKAAIPAVKAQLGYLAAPGHRFLGRAQPGTVGKDAPAPKSATHRNRPAGIGKTLAEIGADDGRALLGNLHVGGPDALFTGRDTVIEGIFGALESLRPDNQAIGG